MTNKLKILMASLFLLGTFTLACSAKEATATESLKPEIATAPTATVVEQTEPVVVQADENSVDERYAALFDSAIEAVKFSLENNPNNFIAGTHYDEFNPRQARVGQGDKIEVVEFFSYGCGHCFSAEPYMHAYAGQVAEDVEFKRVPVSFNPFFEHLARGYYTAKALDADEESHIAIFDAVHIKRKDFRTVESLADFYADYGVDKDQFIKAFNSFSINAQIERDNKLGQAYQISGVPTVIVDGAYSTGGVKAGNFSAWFQILDSLIDIERQKKLTK